MLTPSAMMTVFIIFHPAQARQIDRLSYGRAKCRLNAGGRASRGRGRHRPNGRCKLHGGKSTGPRTREGLERARVSNLPACCALFAGSQGGTVAPAALT